MGFNMLKGLFYIVFGMNVFNQLNYFSIDWFHLSQVKSTDCMKSSTDWYHLRPDYISCLSESWGTIFEFLSTKTYHSSLENLSLNHTVASGRLKILVDLGGIFAW